MPCPPLLIRHQNLHTPLCARQLLTLFALLAMCAGAHQILIGSTTRAVQFPSVRCVGCTKKSLRLAATALGMVSSHMLQLLGSRLCCDSLQQSPQRGCGVQQFAPTPLTESAMVCHAVCLWPEHSQALKIIMLAQPVVSACTPAAVGVSCVL
jgi:hypothetical protein